MRKPPIKKNTPEQADPDATASGDSSSPEEAKGNSVQKRRGRPPKKDVAAKTAGNRKARGRPPGDAAAIAEFKARILTSPKSMKVIESIFDAALDDDHKNQAAAWKLLVDRMMPMSHFEKAKQSTGLSSISINVNTTDGNGVIISGGDDEIDDADYEEME